MRLVSAHFPMKITIPKDGSKVEIQNYLGGKSSHTINMLPGCTVKVNPDLKDELIFDGIDNQNLSITCSQVS